MEPERHWVADAGVLLNLAAVEDPNRLIEELGVALVIPRVGFAGQLRHPRTRERVTGVDQLGLSCIKVVPLSAAEYDSMVEFAAPPIGLYDGEAAMLAISVMRHMGCLVDDPKTIAVIAQQPVGIPVLSTLGLLRTALADRRVSETRVADALRSAVDFAGLVIDAEHADWAMDLIGKKGMQKGLWQLP